MSRNESDNPYLDEDENDEKAGIEKAGSHAADEVFSREHEVTFSSPQEAAKAAVKLWRTGYVFGHYWTKTDGGPRLYVAILTDDAYGVGLEDIPVADAEWQSVSLVELYQSLLRIFAGAFYDVRNCRFAWTDIGEYLLEIVRARRDGRVNEYVESGALNGILAKPETAEEADEFQET